MLANMPISVFHDWLAYYQCEPFGEWRADHRAAVVACTMANAMRGKLGRRARVEDFMPKFGPKVKRQSIGEMKANLASFSEAYTEHREQQKRCQQ